ncbi:MAG: FAD-dependent thymidylate synthase [Planctomycetales bacterium]|nr:FAD-dependent thymidylate synthase [Planctomycetales bacterium]
MSPGFSPAPKVRIVNAFARPYENAVATARTCYSSKGIISTEEVSGDELADPEKRRARVEQRDRIAKSIFEAGHHTTLQHAHFQFALENVSRQFLWAFLHSHPFYNSEQVSQRYVEVKPDAVAMPPLEGAARETYATTVRAEMDAYRRLIGLLEPAAEAEYLARFPARRGKPRVAKEIQKKAQEIARYVLPLGTLAYLYHTVSALTLMRYHRLCEEWDAPLEQRTVVRAMVDEVLKLDPLFGTLLEEPIPLEETLEYRAFEVLGGDGAAAPLPQRRIFLAEFDRALEGRTSRLVEWKGGNERLLAQGVREVLGVPAAALPDAQAIGLVMDPARNPYLGETLTLTTLGKLTRALHHPHYTFRKKLSHTADSQDQRHRTTPASRPCLMAHFTGEPDFILPGLVEAAGGEAARLFRGTMERSWEGARRMIEEGARPEFAAYALPNAVAVRFTESADLAALQHKLAMRLCWNAQEEIWRASMDEAEQIAAVDPEIGRHFGPPCVLRERAGRSPWCPEGDRYCGVPAWRNWSLEHGKYSRVI